MPLFYTHIRYAYKCLDLLQNEYKKIIENNIIYYLCGAQGPNIFKYHSPITNKKYIELSNHFHSNQIANTLNLIKTEIKNSKERDAILSYTFGYITHFVLDSYINSYLKNSSKCINTNIEILKSEIEKYYISKDRVNISTILSKYKTDNKLCTIIGKLLKIKVSDIKQSLSNMIQYNKILYIKNNRLIIIIRKFFKFIHFDKYNDLFINNAQIKHTAQILRFEKYFEISKYHSQLLIHNFINYIFNDDSLDSYYFNTFEISDNNPVLDFNEEKKYIINKINN